MRTPKDMHKACTARKGGAFAHMSCASACTPFPFFADNADRDTARAALLAAGMT